MLSVVFENDIDVIIVHQVLPSDQIYADRLSCLREFSNVSYKRLESPGLSRSRNFGLSHVKTKYAFIMDDDVSFEPSAIKELVNWMDLNCVDVASCKYKFPDGKTPYPYKESPFEHNILSSAKVSSIEICINVDSIRNMGIVFDEKFGLGSELPSGEEYIFLTDCIKSGLRVFHYPVTVCTHPNITSGMDFYSSSKKILAKREMFLRIFGSKGFLFIFAFWLKKVTFVSKKGFFWSFTKTLFLGGK